MISHAFHDLKLVAFLLPLVAMLSFTTSCQREQRVHPAVADAISFIDSTDLVESWGRAKAAMPLIEDEDIVQCMYVLDHGDMVFAMSGERFVDAKWRDGVLYPIAEPCGFERAELMRIERLAEFLRSHDIEGYDKRSMPEYMRVFIRNDVFFLILSDSTSARFRQKFEDAAERGFDVRGDAIRQISQNLYVATERR